MVAEGIRQEGIVVRHESPDEIDQGKPNPLDKTQVSASGTGEAVIF